MSDDKPSSSQLDDWEVPSALDLQAVAEILGQLAVSPEKSTPPPPVEDDGPNIDSRVAVNLRTLGYDFEDLYDQEGKLLDDFEESIAKDCDRRMNAKTPNSMQHWCDFVAMMQLRESLPPFIRRGHSRVVVYPSAEESISSSMTRSQTSTCSEMSDAPDELLDVDPEFLPILNVLGIEDVGFLYNEHGGLRRRAAAQLTAEKFVEDNLELIKKEATARWTLFFQQELIACRFPDEIEPGQSTRVSHPKELTENEKRLESLKNGLRTKKETALLEAADRRQRNLVYDPINIYPRLKKFLNYS